MVTERDVGKRVRYALPHGKHGGGTARCPGTLRAIRKGKAVIEPLRADHKHEIVEVPVVKVSVWTAGEAMRHDDAPTPPPTPAEPTKEHELKATSIQSAAGGMRPPQKAAPLIAGPRVVRVEEPEDDPFAPPAPAPKPEPADATTDMAGLAHELIGAVSQVQKLKADADAAEEFAREARREADKAVARHKEAALAVQNIRQRMNDLVANVCTLEGES